MTGTGDVSLESGKDTNLKGAVVSGEGVKVDVGGNLNVESQLDKERIKIDHTTISGGYGNNSANFDYTKQKGKGKSDTVNEQSGIHAGDSGFDIKVDGNTDLKGGLITSEAGEDKNKLETGTLTWSDVETKSEWSTKTSGFGGTVGPGTQGAPGSGPLIKPTLKDGDKDEGSAKTAVSPGEITITKPDEQKQDVNTLNRDTANTNDEIKGLPDLQKKLNEQLKTQQEWAKAAENMAKGVKEASDYMREHAKSEAEKKLWDEGGAARAALHAIAGGLLGGVNGLDGAIKAAIGAGVSTIIAPHIKKIVDQAIAQSGLKGEDAKRLSDTLTSSIVLGLLSGAGGSDTGGYASNELKYNLLTVKQIVRLSELEEILLKCAKGACSDEEREKVLKELSEIDKENEKSNKEVLEQCSRGERLLCDNYLYKNDINRKYIYDLGQAFKKGEISQDDYEFWKEYNLNLLTLSWYQDPHLVTEFNRAFGTQGEYAIDILTIIFTAGESGVGTSAKLAARAKAAQVLSRPLTQAESIALRVQLTGEEIAAGHAFEKHVLAGEFSEFGIQTRKQYARFIENIIINPSEIRYAKDGRIFYLDNKTRTVVVRNPKAEGTAFRPPSAKEWEDYIATKVPTRNKPH